MPEEPPRDSQFSAHNKAPERVGRIRMAWLIVLLIFVLLGITAVMIMDR